MRKLYGCRYGNTWADRCGRSVSSAGVGEAKPDTRGVDRISGVVLAYHRDRAGDAASHDAVAALVRDDWRRGGHGATDPAHFCREQEPWRVRILDAQRNALAGNGSSVRTGGRRAGRGCAHVKVRVVAAGRGGG